MYFGNPFNCGFRSVLDIYLSNWWMLLCFAAIVATPVLCAIVAIKSRGDYVDFVRFVKKVLLFETISMAYQQGVQQYIDSGFNIGMAIIVFVIILVLGYFLWYRLNVKYFEKRILIADVGVVPTATIPNDAYVNNPVEARPNVNNINFCRKCGCKLPAGSVFCSNCGIRVVDDNQYRI